MESIIVNKRNLLVATAQSFRMCIVIWLDLFLGLGRQKKNFGCLYIYFCFGYKCDEDYSMKFLVS